MGEVSWISGRVLDSAGQPVRNALVEIWQADNNGAYIHSASPSSNRDANFQGYGKFTTASSGEYLFRTVKPGLYPGRTRHVHIQVTAGGRRFVTQLYIQGEALNTNDGVLNGIRDAAQRASVVVPWTAVAGSRAGELAARFDIVPGFTATASGQETRPTLISMVHGASLQPGAAAGSWVTIFGEGLASTTIIDGKLPETLDGVSVRINNKPASVYYVSPKQINVQAPDDAGGQVQVTVTNGGEVSAALTAELLPVLPGFFLLDQDYVAAPAQPGEVVSLFGTGFGPANDVKIQIDGVPAEIRYGGLVSAGVYQFNVVVPDLADGDHAVSAAAGGARTRRLGRLRIQRAPALP